MIERATEMDADLIEVPHVKIAGLRSGPVWFERRPAGAFEERMSSWMDRPIVGALGGNALRAFRVTVDYPAPSRSSNDESSGGFDPPPLTRSRADRDTA